MRHDCNVEITKMDKTIEHQGIIKQIEGGIARIQIIQLSACAGCHAKNACSASDMSEKIIEVPYEGKSYKVGDQVRIIGSTAMGWKAVGYAFVLPFILLMSALVIATEAGVDELIAGSLALAILAPYYLILFLFKDKMRKKFTFRIES